jgi:electron transport complex protein RnfE
VKKEFLKGFIKENPIFVIMLGLCPTLATSTSVINGFGMGIAATFVLVFSNLVISSIRNIVPNKVRIPCYIVVIATFVTIAELFMKAYLPALNNALGIFVPLIVVNCIILGRAEAFASKHGVMASIMDGLGMGFGFTLALSFIAFIREIIGNGSILGMKLSTTYTPMLLAILTPGGFITIGFLMGFFKMRKLKHKAKN